MSDLLDVFYSRMQELGLNVEYHMSGPTYVICVSRPSSESYGSEIVAFEKSENSRDDAIRAALTTMERRGVISEADSALGSVRT